MTFLRLGACVAMGVCVFACRSEDSLYPVRAAISLDGSPLAEGVAYFYPEAGGTPEGGHFKNGVLDFKATPGQKRVEIRSYRENPNPAPAKLKGLDLSQYDTRIQIVPRRYNRDSELTAEVTEDGPNEFTFELSSE